MKPRLPTNAQESIDALDYYFEQMRAFEGVRIYKNMFKAVDLAWTYSKPSGNGEGLTKIDLPKRNTYNFGRGNIETGEKILQVSRNKPGQLDRIEGVAFGVKGMLIWIKPYVAVRYERNSSEIENTIISQTML